MGYAPSARTCGPFLAFPARRRAISSGAGGPAGTLHLPEGLEDESGSHVLHLPYCRVLCTCDIVSPDI